MDHKEQHHQHHRKEREHEKEKRKEHEQVAEKRGLAIHPAWFLASGVALVLAAVLIWPFWL